MSSAKFNSPDQDGPVAGGTMNVHIVRAGLDSHTNKDDRVYLDGMPVGCVAVAYGWQATVSTLSSLRVTVHALRGWPSPLGATVNASSGKIFDTDGTCTDDGALFQLQTVATQVVEFAALRKAGAQHLVAATLD